MNVGNDLKKLEDLYRSGALSDDEFGRAKGTMLGSNPPHNASEPAAVQNISLSSLGHILSEGMDGQPTSYGETAWLPGPDVKDFNEGTLPGDLDFFVAPPPELGSIYCAFSTLKRGQVPIKPDARFICVIGAAVLGAVIGSAVTLWFKIGTIWWVLTLGVPPNYRRVYRVVCDRIHA